MLGAVSGQEIPTFEEMVLATSPYAYYNFQQPMDTGQDLADQSGNGRTLNQVNPSLGPLHGAAARSTTTQTAWWSITSEGAPASRPGQTYFFNDPSGATLNNIMYSPLNSAKTAITLMVSFKYSSYMGNFCKIVGWRDSNSASRFNIYTQWPSGTGHTVEFRTATGHTTNVQYEYGGNWTRDTNWHIATMRFNGLDSGKRSFFLDGVKQGEWATGYPSNDSIYTPGATTSPFEFPGNFSSGGACYMQSDALAMWNVALPDGDVLALHNQWISELL
jgi:hypothetical protein